MIQINLLRVSPDSQYLEFSVECPLDYTFNLLYISRYNVTTKLYDGTIDCSTLLQGTTTKEIMRIATSAFTGDITMYKVEFGVTSAVPENPEIDNAVGVCSNINFVYLDLLNILTSYVGCSITSFDYEKLTKVYIILFAHHEAMRLERYTEAEYFYDLLWETFVSCSGQNAGVSTGGLIRPCNC